MKKVLIPVLALAMVYSANAQEIPERKAEHPRMSQREDRPRAGKAMQDLNLTDAQKEQMKKEKEAFRKKMDDLEKNDNITVKEWKAKRESLAKEHHKNVEAIFTPEQKAKMEGRKKEAEARMKEMGQKRAEHMKTALNLTPEQSAKLEKSHKENAERMKAIREDEKLTMDQKRTAFRELAEKQKETLKATLTEEQLAKMKEMKREHRRGPAGPEGKGPKGPKGPGKKAGPPPPPPADKETI